MCCALAKEGLHARIKPFSLNDTSALPSLPPPDTAYQTPFRQCAHWCPGCKIGILDGFLFCPKPQTAVEQIDVPPTSLSEIAAPVSLLRTETTRGLKSPRIRCMCSLNTGIKAKLKFCVLRSQHPKPFERLEMQKRWSHSIYAFKVKGFKSLFKVACRIYLCLSCLQHLLFHRRGFQGLDPRRSASDIVVHCQYSQRLRRTKKMKWARCSSLSEIPRMQKHCKWFWPTEIKFHALIAGW